MSTRRRVVIVAAAAVVLFLVGAVLSLLQTDQPERFVDIEMHFKYGSIGSDYSMAADEGGVPYWIWRVLPDVFPDILERLTPGQPGTGYERLGFIFEPTVTLDHPRPIGLSFRETAIEAVGVNCAVCHVGTVRDTPGGRAQLVLGMPALRLDFLGYERFLIDAADDSRFNAGTLIDAIKQVNPDFGFFDQMLYRFVVIPRMKSRLDTLRSDFSFIDDLDRHPPWGPGRVDTFTPYKVRFEMGDAAYETAGQADFPAIWNQSIRAGMELHWDGNNLSLDERNLSASIGSGASESSVDLQSIERIKRWIESLPAPKFPADRIDQSLVTAGEPIYNANCALCHSLEGARVGQVEPIATLGTDPSRLDSFDDAIAANMNTLGEGRPWAFSNFRSTDGYANAPLDGIWARAPYLHNGSVPYLSDLLEPAAERPTAFCRGSDLYDYQRVGFVADGAESECTEFWFDTTLVGNGKEGHEYGTNLSADQKRALLEYLKTQ
ncbi:MAG: cytochrome c [Chloroflexi bacterium]|nr:cytochrome c [Chloroflexota bacterium]